jgi:hypothetical protein
MVQCTALIGGYDMRKYIALLLLTLLVPVHAMPQNEDVEMAAMTFFHAVKAGNVEQIRALVADPLLESVKVLLTENLEYPDYLRKRYVGATAEIINVSRLPSGDVLVDMAIKRKPNIPSYMKLRMSQRTGGEWLVVEQSQIY